MENKQNSPRRFAIWQKLLLNKYPFSWAPCITDVALTYQGNDPLDAYIHSEDFYNTALIRLSEYKDVYAYYGLEIKALSPQQLLNGSLLPIFAKGIAGRLRNFAMYEGFSHREISDILLSCIYRKISKYDPERGVPLEAFLQKSVVWDAKHFFERESTRNRNIISLDTTDGDGHSLRDVLAAAPLQLPFDLQRHIYDALRATFIKPADAELFRQAIYSGEDFETIAGALDISKGTLSYRISKIQNRFEKSLLKLLKLDSFQSRRFNVFATAFRIWMNEEEFLDFLSNNLGRNAI